ncbi:hypothetical protein KKC83_01700 [Patescibacteria group bacterium]|nr:hypothetical protein [Patescibacteria group bacterium]MBU4026240.1 hypothetical protein [Patescibacteria group bacterium]MBU4073103.1 hypothetical protein [Patescibacteria group bacterium]
MKPRKNPTHKKPIAAKQYAMKNSSCFKKDNEEPIIPPAQIPDAILFFIFPSLLYFKLPTN